MFRKLLLSIYLTCLISSSCSDQLSGFVNSYVQNDSQSNVEIEFYGSQSENILEAISVEKGGKIIVLNSVAQAQVIQHVVGEIIVKAVPVKASIDEYEKQLIKDRIISQLGEVKISIEEVNEIPLTSNGKFKAVISTVKRK
ncbi:MAG: hypothetical protein MUE72_00950 [Chitinophagaceae bacterium]|nr:hypothetical protein [Chitinophagaceae bacterium]